MQPSGLGQSFTPRTGAGVLHKCLMNPWMSTLLWITLPDWLPVTWQVSILNKWEQGQVSYGRRKEKCNLAQRPCTGRPGWDTFQRSQGGKVSKLLCSKEVSENRNKQGMIRKYPQTILSSFCGSKMLSHLPSFYHLTFNITQLSSHGSEIGTQCFSH